MTPEEQQRQDKLAEERWHYMVRYVKSLSKADQIKWASKQSEAVKAKMREAIRNDASLN